MENNNNRGMNNIMKLKEMTNRILKKKWKIMNKIRKIKREWKDNRMK